MQYAIAKRLTWERYIMSDTPRVVIAMGDPAGISPESVSYTHLTLPTICSV